MPARYLGRSCAASVSTRSRLLGWFALEKCLLNPRNASQDLRAMPSPILEHFLSARLRRLVLFDLGPGNTIPLDDLAIQPSAVTHGPPLGFRVKAH